MVSLSLVYGLDFQEILLNTLHTPMNPVILPNLKQNKKDTKDTLFVGICFSNNFSLIIRHNIDILILFSIQYCQMFDITPQWATNLTGWSTEQKIGK